ncbi:MAG: YgiT-type zinc finger protein [Candidatus Binatia bacterium]
MKKGNLIVSACPSCGSSAIRRVKGNWTGSFRGKSYTVTALEYFACPKCHEKIYPPEAMRRIQERSPAYSKPRVARRAS